MPATSRRNGPLRAAHIEMDAVRRVHTGRGTPVIALDGIDLMVDRGEFVAVRGPSGSGKSTMLNLIGGLDQPTSGSLRVRGRDLAGLDERALTAYRRDEIGFVFQFFNLLPSLSAWENVAVPGMLDGSRLAAARPRAQALLERVGLADRMEHRPAELSGGQLQRVALARALFHEPPLILADEPTGNLDSATADEILSLLAGLAAHDARTVVVVTHDPAVAAAADREVFIQDGRLR
jgi:putative ABC transport system ATP-binding protein